MKTEKKLIIMMAVMFVAAMSPAGRSIAEEVSLPQEEAVLAHAPNVPPPITRREPAHVIVNLEVRELDAELADGVVYTFWTFGGTVPGPMIRIREGDMVEFNLHNHPSSKLPHNIDLHAVTGPGGGAEGSFTAPGHSSTFSFKALNRGLYVYHCATPPVGLHVANGMYGLIYVEPLDGLPPVDREYYIMQSEFYTEGAFGEAGHQLFSMDKALNENPAYVVFNGRVNALTGDNAITANVEEKVRLFLGNGGPNLISSFHVIGEIFDWVYEMGGDLANQNVQTTLIPAGGSAIVDFALQVPGTYILVDHSLFRAFNKGAIGMLKVGGEENHVVYSGKQKDEVYLPDSPIPTPARESAAPEKELSLNERMLAGRQIFNQTCFACHQANGQGIPGVFPPLAQSDYLLEDIDRAIGVVIHGQQGEIVVNDKKYNQVMPAQNLNDEEIANVLSYVLNSWGNEHDMVTPSRVRNVRTGGKK